MKKFISFFLFTFILSSYCYSQNIDVTIRVTNITANGGKVYLALFNNANSFRREQPEFAFELPDSSTTATYQVSLPPGDYLVSAFQDANNNQQLDTNLLGIPRELVGISNYTGQGLPSRNFDRHKIRLDSTTGTVTIQLHKF